MKDETEKFRLSASQKLAIRKAAKRARIGVSALIRLCMESPHSIKSKPDAIRSALGK
jgi:CHAD domain-containing protein